MSYYGRPKKEKVAPPPFNPALYEKTDAIADTLGAKFEGCRKPFACSGAIPLDGALNDLRLFHKNDSETASVPVPLDPKSSEVIWKAGSPSKFGRDNGDVYDESYRRATEIRLPNFALSVDPLLVGNVIAQVEHLMGTDQHLRAEPYKLNAYGPGGLFKAHRDTPKSNDHVGTITLCLPSEFAGGELVVRHGGLTHQSDWANLKGEIGWMFLYSDCEHEVLPVESGTRITIAYDVFSADKQQNYSEDAALKDLEQALKAAYDDKDFLPEGGWVGLGLQHSYFLEKWKTDVSHVGARLKGSDNTWYLAVKSLGLKHKFVGIYDLEDMGYYEDDYEDEDERDDDGRLPSNRGYYKYQDRFLAAFDTFHQMSDTMIGDDYDSCPWDGFEFGTDHIAWLTTPEAYGGQNHYAQYGNKWSTSVCYVALGLTVKFPPPEKRKPLQSDQE